MKDPARLHDTEPVGPADEDDTDPSGTVDETNDTTPCSNEHDTDAFLRWLPTMWLGHRRRKELVQRPSSDGADFVAYACAGRPAPAAARLRAEPSVQVEITASEGAADRVDGELARIAAAAERDAPTVLKRRRSVGFRGGLAAWAAVGLVAGIAVLGWYARQPVAEETAATPTAQRAATAPSPDESLFPPTVGMMSARSEADRTLSAMATGVSAAVLLPSKSRSRPQRAAGAEAATAKGLATPLGAPSAAAAKDQYFETP